MRVEKLTLKNFRNVQDCSFYPGPRVNFLVGMNGQGKTSFLEALGFLSTLRSFRNSKPIAVVQHGKESSEVLCSLISEEENTGVWSTDLRVFFQTVGIEREKASKTAFINGKAYSSSTQYLSQRFGSFQLGFHTIVFNPSDHDLVRGEPSVRRSYLDQLLAASDLEYLKVLQKYQRALVQRNALLKSIELGNADLLAEFTDRLCHYGSQLAFKRLQWLQKVNLPLNQILDKIAPNLDQIRIAHLSSWLPNQENLSFDINRLNSVHFAGQGHLPSLELIEQSFRKKAILLEAAEKKVGHSLVGPHRDDWIFYLRNHPLKGHGSQGEVRSSLLALKLAEIELFRDETGHRPLFLLDDFSSELDQERRSFLLKFLMETDLQTFVTTTEDFSSVGKRFWVSNGNIEEGTHDHRAKPI